MRTRSSLPICAGIAACFVGTAVPLVDRADSSENAGPEHALVLELDGPVGPASSDYIQRGIERAEDSGAHLVILRMDTPGGLDTAMRDIISKILASRVPVVSYVAPPGSRAASAGTYIMYASHVAAMAPATNLGSATPVTMMPGGIGGGEPSDESRDGDNNGAGGDTAGDQPEEGAETEDSNGEEKPPPMRTAMERKVINDAVAYIKGLARLRGRNEQWAEAAVRSAVNLTAEDALEKNVIDLIAKDLQDLLVQLDGRTVETQAGEVTLGTQNLGVEILEPDWRTKLLGIITNPNVAYVLLLLGMYGLFFELSNPGSLFPGVLGGICILLALYAFNVLPVNYAGLALILLGLGFMVGEMFMPSFGILGIGGGVAFVVGSLILMETEVAAFQISLPLIVVVTLVTAAFVFTLITLAVKQRRKPIVSGREQMLGDIGEASTDFSDSGTIQIHGELWSARTDRPVRKGQRVKVREMDGLTLLVEPLEDQK